MMVYDLVFHLEEVRIGRQSTGNELEALKYGDMYVIPFSTWKGAFRSVTEAILPALSGRDEFRGLQELREEVERMVDSAPGDGDQLVWRIGEEVERASSSHPEIEGLDRVLRDVLNPESGADEIKRTARGILASYLRPEDRLYGGPRRESGLADVGFAGALLFSDSVMSGERMVVTRTSINRKTRKVEEHMLYSEEVIRPGTVRLRVILHNVPAFARVTWIETLRFVGEVGLGLGSGKSRRSWATLNLSDSVVREITLKGLMEPRVTSLRDVLK